LGDNEFGLIKNFDRDMQAIQRRANQGGACRAADPVDRSELIGGDAGIGDGGFQLRDGGIDVTGDQRLVLGAGNDDGVFHTW